MTKITDLADQIVQEVAAGLGKPPYSLSQIQDAVVTLDAVQIIKSQLSLPECEVADVEAEQEGIPTSFSAAAVNAARLLVPAPVVEASAEAPKAAKPRRTKAEIEAELDAKKAALEAANKADAVKAGAPKAATAEDVADVAVATPVASTPAPAPAPAQAPEVAQPTMPAGGETPADKLLFKHPQVAGMTNVLSAAEIAEHCAKAQADVKDYLQAAIVAQQQAGNSHGRMLFNACFRRLGGTINIASVAPAKWPELVTLGEAVRTADLSGAPALESTDDAGYDALLAKVLGAATPVATDDL